VSNDVTGTLRCPQHDTVLEIEEGYDARLGIQLWCAVTCAACDRTVSLQASVHLGNGCCYHYHHCEAEGGLLAPVQRQLREQTIACLARNIADGWRAFDAELADGEHHMMLPRGHVNEYMRQCIAYVCSTQEPRS
jgi:hypothetical protein